MNSLNYNFFLSHLVPTGTPYVLIPFMVIIELISRVIRPLTLSVRLAANIVAGHLLIVFDNIIEKIKSSGFRDTNFSDDARYTLNIQNEFIDPRSGRTKMSNIRTTISGIHNIQKYCKTNTLNI